MLDWDKRIKADRVGARLRTLGPRSWVSFAAGALEHAYRVVRVRESWKESKTVAGKHVEGALKHAWQFVGTGRTSVSLEKEIDKIHVDAPNEDRRGAPGEGDLLTGAMDLLDLIGRPSADAARDLASQGYQAVMGTAIPDVAGGEATVLAAERASPECQAEIDFQLAYLAALEKLGTRVPLFGTVVAEMERKP